MSHLIYRYWHRNFESMRFKEVKVPLKEKNLIDNPALALKLEKVINMDT